MDAFTTGATSLDWADTFWKLPADYAAQIEPEPLSSPRMLHFNRPLAGHIGLPADAADDARWLSLLSGNTRRLERTPLATVYAGHQFGHFVPQLGDGRALLLGQVRNAEGELFELQLKGAGKTPFSRFADGRAVLRSSLREYLCSEAMHGLGVPTTRALSLVGSPDPVQRETVETAAVVCRVAPSFVRFGHFEFFYYHQRHALLAPLADHIIAHHFPSLPEAHAEPSARYAAWLGEVIERTARMVAQWQTVGFCHGVMNTDNFSILGLTIDYGPFGFLDGFRSGHICNHSDEAGRYAYEQQPRIGYWNCSKLLQATLPLLHDTPEAAVEMAQALLARYPSVYAETVLAAWRAKLGLAQALDGDRDLVNGLLNILDRGANDFTRSFRGLSQVRTDSGAPPPIRDEITDLDAFDAWLGEYRTRLRSENSVDAERAPRTNALNPCYVLRNHLAQNAIGLAEHGEYTEIDTLMRLLADPFVERPDAGHYAAAPPPGAEQVEVSCSS